MRKVTRVFAVVFISICLFCPMAEALSLTITNPCEENTGQRIFAPKRDFYVQGTIDRTGAPVSFDIRVDVFSADVLIRRVQSVGIADTGVTSADAVSFDYKEYGSWFNYEANSRDMLTNTPPADLIFRPGAPDSFYDQSVKLAVTADRFSAIIFGGATKSFDVTESTLSGDITAGTYRIVATAISPDYTEITSDDITLTIGVVPKKILARFSPPEHLSKTYSFANGKYRIYYNDYFPGYCPVNITGGKTVIYEIPKRWRPNDSMEYDEGEIYTVLYNIDNDRCATQRVEIAYLAKHGMIDSDRVHFHRYDIGEPSIKHFGGTLDGKIISMDKAKKFELIRAEFRKAGSVPDDNVYYAYKTDKYVDLKVTESVKVPPRELFSIFGVVVPISADAEEGTGSDYSGSYSIKDRIDTIRYELKDGDAMLLSCDKAIGLERWYSPDDKWATYPSIYEYKHDFVISNELLGKKLTMDMYAYTSLDKVNEIASQSITLNIAQRDSGGSNGCNAGIGALLLLIAIPLVLRSKED